MKIVFTPTHFYQYAKSPHWIWFEKFGDKKKRGDVPALVDKFAEEGVKHEKNYIKGLEYHEIILPKKPSPKDIDEAVEQTSIWMKEGVDRIYQGYLRTEKDDVIYKGRPDFLEKRPGKSALGDYYYIPVDIKNSSVESGDEAKLQYRLQLAMYAWILKEIQHFSPDHAIIINRDSQRVEVEMDSDLSITMWDQVKKIVTIMKGKEPPLKISSAAKDSPWYNALLEKAKDADDIALLYNVNETALHDLRKHGIKTVKQAAKIEPFDLPYIRGISEINLERVQMQAEALIENKVIWRQPAEIPEGKMKIYFDIEGDPFLKIDYLYGFWIVGDRDKEPYFKYFIAKKEEEEGKMWADFMKWVKTIHEQDYKIYHYSPYETSSIKRLEKAYGGSDELTEFKNHFVDLAKIAKKSVIFPLYFYSIKDIAKSEFLNYQWSHPEASGANSIFWYEKWLEEGDRKVLQDIIDYNEDDVKATHVLHEWLKKNSPQQ